MLTPSRRFSPFLTLVWGWCGVGGRPATPPRRPRRTTRQRPSARGELSDFCDAICPSDDIGARYAEVLERLERGEEPYAATL